MNQVRLYWETLRHLKPVQLYGRLWFRLHWPKLDVAAKTPLLSDRTGPWQRPATRPSSMLGPSHFRFLNLEHRLPPTGGWNDTAMEKLWLYNLHYFDDLNAKDAHLRGVWHQALLVRWIHENPPTVGNGWEPYPTSLRIVNWVKWLLAGHTPPPVLAQSLAIQARWLTKRLEWHLLGNHLFSNGKALVFAGLLFDGDEAARWLTLGLRILGKEMIEQVLPDGGHFERSTMYHAIIFEDVLDLLNAANVWPHKVDSAVRSHWYTTARRMLGWLEGMVHPDGQIALFNDAAFGIAAVPQVLRSYALSLAVIADRHPPSGAMALRHWENSGYVRLSASKAVAILDVAPIGPDYLPGHAHADTLSFEMSVSGQRVVVNGGTSRYGLGPERLRERQTASHSTVEVSGLSSSNVWGGFRVAQRARPFDLQVREDAERLCVACSHDGYSRLPGKPVHRREWVMDQTSLMVTDTVTVGQHMALARYLLHPAVQPFEHEHGWQLDLPLGYSLQVKVLAGHARLEPARYAPAFGKVLQTQCLAIELAGGQARTHWFWN